MSSLYVHIPFCDHICAYCDFCKVFYKSEWVDRYLDALAYEIKDKELIDSYDTIYIGGGTPSSLSLDQLERLFCLLAPFTNTIKEYSIEVNPESLTEDKLLLMKKYKINRISIGVQSFKDEVLEGIGRKHHYKDALNCIMMCQKYHFEDINVDLMYGLPHQMLDDVLDDIELLSKYDISHISLYSLILEEHTQLMNMNYIPLDDDEDALWYESIHNALKKHGYNHYEVSNYYRKKPSIHNLVYWHYEDYEGIGVSAHSLKNHCRYENTRSLTAYLKNDYLACKEELSLDDEMFEMIMMGLRLKEGICLDTFYKRYHQHLYESYKDVIERYQKMDLLVIENGFLKTTFKGINFLNTILVDFMK